MPELFEILVQTELGEFVLQVYPEIHVLDRMNNNVHELHTGDHELYMKTIILGEVCHERCESSPFRANLLEVVERG